MKTKRLIFLSSRAHGWGNGYVAVPPEHPLWGKTYFDDDFPDLCVHGGVTFTEPCVYGEETAASKIKILSRYVGRRCLQLQQGEHLDGDIPDDWWLIGFDTDHWGDNEENWPKERVIEETTNLQLKIEQMFNKKSTDKMTEFLNLTPHKIVLNSGKEFAPTGVVARVSNSFTDADADGICEVSYGAVESLPVPVEGVRYIVSAMVLAAVKELGRTDCVAPATGHPDCKRNEKGQIVSVPCFVK